MVTEISNPKAGALDAFHRRHWSIFPLSRDTKKPNLKWPEWECTEASIDAYLKSEPMRNWGVDCGKSGLFVLDIDMKNGVNGYESLAKLLETQGVTLPDTLEVSTPSGGLHIYFQGQGPNSTSKIAPGLDTKSGGGLVVLYGGAIGDATYEITKDPGTIALVPEWLLALAVGATPTPVSELPAVAEVGSRNNTLHRLASSMRGAGLGPDAIRAALHEENAIRCVPPLEAEEVNLIAGSVATYLPEEAKAVKRELEAKAAFAEVNESFKLRRACDFSTKIIPRDWILGDRLIAGYISLLIAPGGVGKSMLQVAEAMAIATGRSDLCGAPVHKPGPVWIHSTEDPADEIERKIMAFCNHWRLPRPSNLFYSSSKDSNLIVATKAGGGSGGTVVPVDANIQLIEHQLRTEGIVAMFIDPFVRTYSGLNENDNADIDRVVQILTAICDNTRVGLSLAHHTPKRRGAGESHRGDMDTARGASSLASAARIAHTLDKMNAKEAGEFGVAHADAWRYLRYDNAKANLAPPATAATWYEKVSHRFEHLAKSPGNQSVGVMTPAVGLVPIKNQHVGDAINLIIDVLNQVHGGQAKVGTLAKSIMASQPWRKAFTEAVGKPEKASRSTIMRSIESLIEFDNEFVKLEAAGDGSGFNVCLVL